MSKKYSYEFKLKIVQEYLNGTLGYTLLSKKYNISSTSQLQKWVNQYKKYGKEGLKTKRRNKKYTLNFKLDVLRFKQDTGASYKETANAFGISEPSIIANWKSKYLKEGTEGLNKPQGRPPKMPKLNQDKNKADRINKNNDQVNQENERLKKENEYLRIELEYLKVKSAGLERPTRKQQVKIVYELTQEGFKLSDILEVTELPESTYHYHLSKKNEPNKDKGLEELIQEIFEENKERYGYRRITDELKARGYQVNHKRVLRLMRKLGLQCIKFSRKTRRYNSYKGTIGKIAKNKINRRFMTPNPLQKLVTDVTEFKCLNDEKLYLSPIMDLYNREVISWEISKRPTLDIAIEPLKEAISVIKKNAKYRTTIHSDQGWHYQHHSWVKTLKKNGIFQSMSRKGNCVDNSPMENFFGLLKQEMYYGEEKVSFSTLKKQIEEYIYYYNNKRIKRKLSGLSPVEYRKQDTQLAA